METCERCAVSYLAEFSEKHDLPWKIGKWGWLYHTSEGLDATSQAHEYDDLLRRVKNEVGKRTFHDMMLCNYRSDESVVPKVRRYHRNINNRLLELHEIREQDRLWGIKHGNAVHPPGRPNWMR